MNDRAAGDEKEGPSVFCQNEALIYGDLGKENCSIGVCRALGIIWKLLSAVERRRGDDDDNNNNNMYVLPCVCACVYRRIETH